MDEPAFVVRSPSDDFSRFTIPEHELLRPIAKGAYGEVWLARNVVGTLRAVKIVRRDRHESSESFDREFKGLQKFEPVSRSHDSLVDILALGLLPGGAGFYYVMELADDASTPVATIQVANFTVSKNKILLTSSPTSREPCALILSPSALCPPMKSSLLASNSPRRSRIYIRKA